MSDDQPDETSSEASPPPPSPSGWAAPGAVDPSEAETTSMPVAGQGPPLAGHDDTTQMPTQAQPTPPPPGQPFGAPQGPPPGPPQSPPYGAPHAPPAGAWGAPQAPPPGYGQAPPPGYGPPQTPPAGAWGAPQGAQPPGTPVPGAPTASGDGSPRRRTALVIGLVVVTLLVVGGVLSAVLLASGDSELDLTIDRCEIAADGTMTAEGIVLNDGGDSADVTVEVVFSDAGDDGEIDRQRNEVTVPAGASERWSASSSAGDEVRRITCDVTATP